MSVASLLAEIERSLGVAKLHDEKLAKGIRSSAPKLRASLLEIGKLVGESRKLALEAGKSIPVKHRAPKEAEVIAESVAQPISEAIAMPLAPVELAPLPAAPVVAPKKRGVKKPAAVPAQPTA